MAPESAIKRIRESATPANQATSSNQGLRELFDPFHADDVDVGTDLLAVGLGDDDRPEAEGGGFAGAQVRLRHAADLAEEPDFPEDSYVVGDRSIAVRREQGGHDAEIDGRLVDLQSPGHVHVDVAGHEVAARP